MKSVRVGEESESKFVRNSLEYISVRTGNESEI